MSFSALEVKKLRQMTNAPMMECKKALEESDGDIDAAVKVLRERGIAKMAKRADRATAEGIVRIQIGEGNCGGTAVVVTCETDFTAKNEQFQALADTTVAAAAGISGDEISADQVLEAECDGKTVRLHLEDVANAVRENMGLDRVVRYGGVAGGYVHFNGKTGVMVEATVADDGKAGAGEITAMLKDVSMHVASADPAPLGVSQADIDPQTVEDEKSILIKQALDSGKPKEIAEKMVEGRMKKFYSERALLEQAYVKSPDKSVGDYVGEIAKSLGTDVAIVRFERMKIGG